MMKFFLKKKFWPQKPRKTWFLGRKSWKNGKVKKFWSKSIQNVLTRILKRRSRNRKFFPITNFFVGPSHFLPKMTKTLKKLQSQKILVENVFGLNRLRMFWNVFKNENLVIEIFSHYKFLLLYLVIFCPKWPKQWKNG